MKPTINLAFRAATGNFEVLSTKNTLRYIPGDYIRKQDVQELINSKCYSVNIKGGAK